MEGQYGNTIISRHGGGFCGRLCFDLHHKRKIALLLRHLLKIQLPITAVSLLISYNNNPEILYLSIIPIYGSPVRIPNKLFLTIIN